MACSTCWQHCLQQSSLEFIMQYWGKVCWLLCSHSTTLTVSLVGRCGYGIALKPLACLRQTACRMLQLGGGGPRHYGASDWHQW